MLMMLHAADETKQSISSAMTHFANRTCVQFRSRTDDDDDYVFFIYQPGQVIPWWRIAKVVSFSVMSVCGCVCQCDNLIYLAHHVILIKIFIWQKAVWCTQWIARQGLETWKHGQSVEDLVLSQEDKPKRHRSAR